MPAALNISELRADIKNWERAFKAKNARDPTINDIKLQPHIADKYKLYKKLSKPVVTPSTPPRLPSPDHLLTMPAIRPIVQTAPLSTFNPFSPNKMKKQKAKATVKHELSPNPFKSPGKSRSHDSSSPSLELFPLRFAPDPTSSSILPSISPPYPSAAMSRARKRLRGEPVSPSPSKEKRRRVISQTSLPFPHFQSRTNSDDLGCEGEEETLNDSSFVDNSPSKPHAKGKHFAPLFNARNAPIDDLLKLKAFTHNPKSGLDVFHDTILDSRMSTSGSLDLTASGESTNQDPSAGAQRPRGSSVNILNLLYTQKSHWHDADTTLTRDIRSSRKRSISDAEKDPSIVQKTRPQSKPRLLPPSPPAASGSSAASKRPQGKTIDTRKKAKLANNTEIDGESESEGDLPAHKGGLKLIDRSHTRVARTSKHDDEYIGLDSDPILGYARLTGPHGHSIPTTSHPQDGKFEVDLPDKLRRVLSLGYVDAKWRDCQEAQVANSVLYGRKRAHYNPDKGGEIWDIGENDVMDGDESTRSNVEVEDDWEGEPVPWEVGEL
ncbi:hypothetical protein K443DRAFT_2347 [Laccaria amethystina LaAM-08-1]|uniref:DNA replication regulator SLD2 n=1 Tax=Laccaria amethystina LaAM-08-1 TaxID=1095629 RepID=A0A0C9X5Q9_9AGAR|nr:hypothetical protein K443DRAFT_2347 [Laccaria amethystina LaAM-08-1]